MRYSGRITAALAVAALAVAAGTTVPAAASAPTVEVADAPAPLASFTFDEEPADGAFVSGSLRAAVQGTTRLAAAREGHGLAAHLSSEFWLDVRTTEGTAALAGHDALTISYDSAPDAAGNVGWSVFAAPSAAPQNYGTEHYLGVLDRADEVTVERYSNTAGRDTSANLTATPAQAWRHVDLVIAGTTARLYVDRNLVAARTTGPALDEMVGADGVLQVGKGNWGTGEYFSGLIDNLTIYDRALTADELGVAPTETDLTQALAVPAVVIGDLPGRVLGRDVRWSAVGPGADRLRADGTVDTSGLGSSEIDATVTASVDGEADPISYAVKIAAPGGEIASYVKTVTTVAGAKDDPLAYADDRRADSLFVAARGPGDGGWAPLNRGQAILSVLWDDTQAAKPWAQMGSPSLFRDADGHIGIVASQNNSTASIFVWTSTDDHTFTQQRVFTLGGIVSDPSIIAAANGGYRVFWTDLASGEGRVSTLSSLAASATVSPPTRADARALGADGSGLPGWATQSQTTVTALTSDQYAAFVGSYIDLQNTRVEPIVAAAAGADADSVASALPASATFVYNDGSTKSLPVEWSQADITAAVGRGAGEWEVRGSVVQHARRLISDARADPHVFYNEDDGYYYLTGSHYGEPSTGAIDEATSYRKIGLKRATTLEGLADAPERIVIDPDAGTPGMETQFPNTFYGWGGYIWAQEFHKINGRWWIVAGMNRGYAATGGWCDNTVLIPYTGSTASIASGGFFDETNWGEPVVLDGAAFDVTYIERSEGGDPQGYWIMPSGGEILVGKAKMGPVGTVPLLDGPLTTIYRTQQVWERGKQAPTPTDTDEGADQAVVEAPFAISYGDRIYLTYSGGTVDKYYNLGLLTASADAALEDPTSWTQTAYPLLSTADTFEGRLSEDEAVASRDTAGPGHNSLIVDASGNLLLAYHARPYPDPHTPTDPNGAGGLFDPDRSTWFTSVNVRASGALDFSLSKEQEVAPAHRTVTAIVKIAAAPSPTPTPTPTPTAPTPTPDPTPSPTPSGGSATPAPSTAQVRASAARVEQGGTVAVTVTGLSPAERVTAELHSDRILITGIPAADAGGTTVFTVRIPSSLAPGTHGIVVRRADGTLLPTVEIEVIAAQRLAASGGSVPFFVVFAGLCSVLLGAGLRARRRSATRV